MQSNLVKGGKDKNVLQYIDFVLFEWPQYNNI